MVRISASGFAIDIVLLLSTLWPNAISPGATPDTPSSHQCNRHAILKGGKNALRTRRKCRHIDRNVSACRGDHSPEAAIEFVKNCHPACPGPPGNRREAA